MKYCDSIIFDRSIAKKCFMIAHYLSSHRKTSNFFIVSGTKIRTCSFFLLRKKKIKRTQVLQLLKYCSGREMIQPEERRSYSHGCRDGQLGAPVPWPLICHILQCHCHLPNNHSSNTQVQNQNLSCFSILKLFCQTLGHSHALANQKNKGGCDFVDENEKAAFNFATLQCQSFYLQKSLHAASQRWRTVWEICN